MNVITLDAAEKELQEAVNHYNEQRDGLGDEFADEVERTVRRICDNPGAWTRLSESVRRCRTERFPYGLVYQRVDDIIYIIAVMHLRRRPGYWRDRLSEI